MNIKTFIVFFMNLSIVHATISKQATILSMGFIIIVSFIGAVADTRKTSETKIRFINPINNIMFIGVPYLLAPFLTLMLATNGALESAPFNIIIVFTIPCLFGLYDYKSKSNKAWWLSVFVIILIFMIDYY